MILNCHTFFSLKYGTLSPEELVLEAIDKGMDAVVLTDINNTSAAYDFISLAKKNCIKPLIGIEYRNEDELLYIGIARNNRGFARLNSFLSSYNTSKEALPFPAPEFDDAYIIYPFLKRKPEELRENEFIGIRINELNRFTISEFSKKQDRVVMLASVTFKNKIGYNTHRLLRAIGKNTLLSKITSKETAPPDEVMLSIDKLISAYSRFPKLIQNTTALIDSCSIEFNSENKNKKYFTGDAYGDKQLLEKLAMDGLKERYGTKNKIARDRVLKELDIINKLSFNAYFLITWDFIRYAVNRNFAYVGRGSGANSIVAYCLKITDVDPIELDLYFERFLNPHRTSPPDFDIDFAWNERDEVIDYIFKRYGEKHTVLLATYSTFKDNAIIRELGKALGLPKGEIDALADNNFSKIKTDDRIIKSILKYGEYLQNLPHHLGIHAGGILITEYPINSFTATDLPPKGFPITHFDMWVAEEAGFYKFDVLSQRGLGHIRDTISIVKANTGRAIDLNFEKAKNDPVIKKRLKDADTIGCFYIESPAMRGLLQKLHCDDYITLVAASSIIRPGVAQSGMMQEYIRNFHAPDKVKYLHPVMEELLKETFGVMVYQEDVIKVAHHYAGLSLAESDLLRRAMSGKYRGSTAFAQLEKKFFTGAKELGRPEDITKEVWRQIVSFSGYSFSKAHSASFAVESFHSLYLKAYYPIEFMVAVINNFGGFYTTEFYVHEARVAGADIQAPCLNNTEIPTIVKGKTIYIGFQHIKSLEGKLAEAIVTERAINGKYRSLTDFIKRIPIGIEQLKILIRTGAFRFTGKAKKVLILEAHLLFSKSEIKVRGGELFESDYKNPELPALDSFAFQDEYDQIELLGFALCHPFKLLPAEYTGKITASQMKDNINKRITIIGYYVTYKHVSTIRKEAMAFMHFISADGYTFDTTHFPPSLRSYPLQGKGFYELTGKVVEQFGYPSIEVDKMVKLPMVNKEVIRE